MANKIETFMKKNLGTVRVILKKNNPWFVLADVLKILGYTSVGMISKALSYLDKSEKGFTVSETLGGKQTVAIINESGLYFLICKSKKPAAKDFRLWVTGTVLPSIRKNGGYIAGQEKLDEEKKKILEEEIRKLSEVIENLTERNEILKNENEELTAEISDLMYSRDEDAYISTNDGGYVTETEYEKYYA